MIRLTVGIGLLVYLFATNAIEWSALRGLLTAWPVTVAAFIVVIFDTVVTSWRLCVLMEPRGLHLSLAAATRLTVIGHFFNTCLPGATGGDAVKIYYAARENHGRRVEVATVLLLDRFVGMFALLLLPLLAAPFFWQAIRGSAMLSSLLTVAAVIAVAMFLAMLAALSTTLRSNWITKVIFEKIPFGVHLERIVDTVHSYRRFPGSLAKATGISLVAHSMAISIVLLLVHAISLSGVSPIMCLLIPLGFLANTIPLTPGGLGVGEAAFDRLFGLFGLAGGAEALLGWRFLMLLTGLLGLVCYLRGHSRLVHDSRSYRRLPSLVAEPIESSAANASFSERQMVESNLR